MKKTKTKNDSRINGLRVVNKLICSGSLISSCGCCRNEIKRRTNMHPGVIYKRRPRQLSADGTKIRIIKTLVFPFLPTVAEKWIIRIKEKEKSIRAFELLWCSR